jgi:hypothetical protein
VADQDCPVCGASLPAELGQHTLAPMTGLVECPSCGSQVELRGGLVVTHGGEAGGHGTELPDTSGEPESFSGEETVAGVMEELEHKPGGPTGDEAGGAA